MSFINTHGVTDILNRHWLAGLFPNTRLCLVTRLKFTLCLISFGLLAPLLMEYRSDDIADKIQSENTNTHSDK